MKFLTIIYLFLSSNIALACSGCAGSMSNPKDRMITYVLIAFILSTYIPYYFIFKMIRKGNQPLTETSAIKIDNENINNK